MTTKESQEAQKNFHSRLVGSTAEPQIFPQPLQLPWCCEGKTEQQAAGWR
jgi:hypothetical protein